MTQPGQHGTSYTTRRLGGGMIAAAWVAVLAVLTVLFWDRLEHLYNPNREVRSVRTMDGERRVRLAQNRHGHYVATGAINGEPVVFLLDTGATDVSVPAGLARRLGLEAGARALAQTANGVVTTYRTILDRVQLGAIELRGVRAHINPGMNGNDVLLGMSFLRDLEFSQRDGVLTLTQPEAG
jgi:aspartyl protease family protein